MHADIVAEFQLDPEPVDVPAPDDAEPPGPVPPPARNTERP
jgi:hypothetical protein